MYNFFVALLKYDFRYSFHNNDARKPTADLKLQINLIYSPFTVTLGLRWGSLRAGSLTIKVKPALKEPHLTPKGTVNGEYMYSLHDIDTPCLCKQSSNYILHTRSQVLRLIVCRDHSKPVLHTGSMS